MGNAAKAITGIAVEAGTSGMQVLLNPTLISALPASLTTPIPGAAITGMRLVIAVYNHSATGTISIAGTAPLSGAVVTETSTNFAVPELGGETVFYVTSNVFATVNASGVTLGGGLTGATVTILGIQAASRLLLGESKLSDKSKEYSPLDQRGTFDRDYQLVALSFGPEWEWQGDYYPTDTQWIAQGGYASAAALTVTTIPAAPPTLATSVSVATSGNASLTTQPASAGPGMVLAIALGGTAPATAGTVTISGIDEYGEPCSEVVVPATKVQKTYYSQNRFASVNVNGVAFTAFGAGATITITGIYGWKIAGNPGDTLNSFAVEQYDSTGSFVGSYALISEWTHEGGMDKEYKVSAKGPMQFINPVGDVTNPASQITAFPQIVDRPLTGWRTLVYLDPIGGTALSTQQPDAMDFKIGVKINWTGKYTSWAPYPSRLWNRAYRNRREVDVEVVLDMTPTTYATEYQAYKQRKTRLLGFWVRGQLIGTDAGVTYYEGCQWILPVKWLDMPERDFAGKDSVELKLKGKAYFLPSLGYSHNLTQFTTLPTW